MPCRCSDEYISLPPRVGRTAVPALFMTALGAIACALAGCGAAASRTTPASPPATKDAAALSTRTATPAPGLRHHRADPLRRGRRHPPARPRSLALAYSTAANDVVHGQPGPGSCHALGAGLDERPDPGCTPGALDPEVTQATIERTICVGGWTETVRPPESVTEQEKAASMAAYGDTGSLGDYEYDHFVPLELGGATNDPRNLWPEPGASPNPKDTVENELRSEVCDGQVSLAAAQREIVRNWVALAHSPVTPAPTSGSPSPPASSGGGGSATCTVSTSYSSRYHDYDVYVHSNQPGQKVTVTDPPGTRTAGTRTRAAMPTCTSRPVARRPATPSRSASARRRARQRSDRAPGWARPGVSHLSVRPRPPRP